MYKNVCLRRTFHWPPTIWWCERVWRSTWGFGRRAMAHWRRRRLLVPLGAQGWGGRRRRAPAWRAVLGSTTSGGKIRGAHIVSFKRQSSPPPPAVDSIKRYAVVTLCTTATPLCVRLISWLAPDREWPSGQLRCVKVSLVLHAFHLSLQSNESVWGWCGVSISVGALHHSHTRSKLTLHTVLKYRSL